MELPWAKLLEKPIGFDETKDTREKILKANEERGKLKLLKDRLATSESQPRIRECLLAIEQFYLDHGNRYTASSQAYIREFCSEKFLRALEDQTASEDMVKKSKAQLYMLSDFFL